MGETHFNHLWQVLKKHYNITEDLDGTKFAGIDLGWIYTPKHYGRSCRLSMKGYIEALLNNFGRSKPNKPQLTPHKYREITYGANQQLTQAEYTRPALDDKCIRCMKAIFGSLLYYACAVENKIIFGLSSIGVQQAAATESTAKAIDHLLDYCSTYPNHGILFRASDMVLAAHSDAGNFSNCFMKILVFSQLHRSKSSTLEIAYDMKIDFLLCNLYFTLNQQSAKTLRTYSQI